MLKQAYEAALATGAMAGPLDSIMPGHLMERLFAGIGGRKTQLLINLLLEGGTEAVTEGAQSVIENAVAKKIYDADRSYWDGMVESAEVGGAVGSIASVIVSLATGQRVHHRQTRRRIKRSRRH